MGLPAGRLNSPLFAPTPTEGGFAQFGTPSAKTLLGQGQPQPIPFPELAALAPQAIPRLTSPEMDAIRKRALEQRPTAFGQRPMGSWLQGQSGGGFF